MRFSVLLPVYHADRPEHLQLALESLLEQSLLPSEVVLVEDGPLTPALERVLEEFQERSTGLLKRVKKEYNEGLVRALNTGLSYCSHELVARMDSDDVCTRQRFEKQVCFFEKNPEYALVGGMLEEFIEIQGDMQRYRKLPLSYEDILAWSKKRSPFNHPTVMYRKSVIQSLGGYRQFSNFEDYYLWAKFLHSGHKAANLPDVLIYFRLGADFIKRRKGVRYFFREYALMKELRRMKFLSRTEFARNIAQRLPLRIMPDFIVKWVYWYYIRKKG